MALMTFREPNQVRWVGVRPAHRGTQIIKSQQDIGTAGVILHTVSDDVCFYLTQWSFSWYTAALGNARFLVRNAADVIQYYISYGAVHANYNGRVTGNFWPPLEISEKWDLWIECTGAGNFVSVEIHGWEE